MLRALLIVLGILIVAVVLAGFGGWLYLRSGLPQTTGTLTLAGLDGPVEVVRDENGVPHIFAATDHDAIFALGYVHAQDRMWQMEMNRRIGSGRLSEYLGEATLDIDKYQRTMGYRRASAAAWDVLSDQSRAILTAYADGVNAWIGEGHTLPPEYILLGVKPEPWDVLDSMVWIKMMQYDLGGDYELELLRPQVIAALGEERASQLLPGYPADGPVILPGGVITSTTTEPSGLASTAAGLLAIGDQFRSLYGITGREQGSNNWVIGGDRTETSLPLLANDPHLGASIPSIWYLAEIQGDTLHVTGATFPSLPLFPIGHNEDIAWGVTNMNPDVQDLYLERINPQNPNQVEYDGAWEEMTIVEEEIRVKGRDEPIRYAARATRHGPLLSDVVATTAPVSLRWTALDPDDTTIEAYLGINYAENWDDFVTAMTLYVAPSQNFVFADVEGNIGYFAPGRIPIRAQGEGYVPAPGWNDDFAWTGFIPLDELPQTFNPGEGYVATANNRVVGDEYPYFLSNDWSEPWRAQRIVELIETLGGGGETISRDDMVVIQGDQESAQVPTTLPFLLSVPVQTQRQRDALGYLQAWNGVSDRASVAQSIYAAWRYELERALFADDLRGALYDDVADLTSALFAENVLTDATLGALWCDDVRTTPAETCEETALVALDRGLDRLEQMAGTRMDRWAWGDLHQTQYPHRPFSEVAYLKRFFHRTIPNGGDGFTVNVAPYRYSELFQQYHVPGYRQIVDLADFNNSLFVTTTGESGNVLSRHYDDFIERHRDVRYLPMTFGRENVSGDVLTLRP